MQKQGQKRPMRARKRPIKSILDLLSGIFVSFLLLLAFLMVGIRIFGFYPYVVLSGSMEPTYPVGSMIYVRRVAPERITVGTPVTFILNNQTVVTHRVVEIDTAAKHFIMKGDANNVVDGSPVGYSQILGVPKFHIPMLGRLAALLQIKPIRFGLIGLVVILAFVLIFPEKKAPRSRKGGQAARPQAPRQKGRPQMQRRPEGQRPQMRPPVAVRRVSIPAPQSQRMEQGQARPQAPQVRRVPKLRS